MMLYKSPMKMLSVLVMFVAAVTSQSDEVPDTECPPNQEFYNCKPCPNLCGNQIGPCLEICKPGCACKSGFVLQNANTTECIPENECITCGELEVFTECGAQCPPRCEETPCIDICEPGCICKEGYVLYFGDCVPRSWCPDLQ